MSTLSWLIAMGSFALSYTIVGAVCRVAAKHNLMDVPNERSSHLVATPRGGGVGIVVAFLGAITALWSLDSISARLYLGLLFSSAAVALVGYLDDRHHLGAPSRFLVHIAAATIFVAAVGVYPADELVKWGLRGVWVRTGVSVLALVWSTNLVNFMDGIDGLAASESIFIATSAGVLVLTHGGDAGLSIVLFSLAMASLGFIFWNWPPARIFMGDVGSGFLGFVLCACLMAVAIERSLPIEILPILGGVFFVDATFTLIRRVLQGDQWLEPHRTHAYQWMARKFGRHRPVTLGVTAVNLFWLFPWAFECARFPAYGPLICLAALLPLVIIAIATGAGKRERKSPRW